MMTLKKLVHTVESQDGYSYAGALRGWGLLKTESVFMALQNMHPKKVELLLKMQ